MDISYELKLICLREILLKHNLYYKYSGILRDILYYIIEENNQLNFDNFEEAVLNFINKE